MDCMARFYGPQCISAFYNMLQLFACKQNDNVGELSSFERAACYHQVRDDAIDLCYCVDPSPLFNEMLAMRWLQNRSSKLM